MLFIAVSVYCSKVDLPPTSQPITLSDFMLKSLEKKVLQTGKIHKPKATRVTNKSTYDRASKMAPSGSAGDSVS